MKKIVLGKGNSLPFNFRKALLCMKLSVLLIIVFCLQASGRGFSQDVKISLNLTEVKFSSALSVIEKKSGYRFFYSNDDLPETAISIIVREERLSAVLGQILSRHGLKYKLLENNAIVISQSVGSVAPVSQAIIISGKVTDSKNTPLAGVSVKVKNSQLGTVTNGDGLFSLSFPDDVSPIVVFSYVGYEEKEMPVSHNQKLNIVLEQQASGMNEVVVVGYGKQKKSTSTAAVSTLRGKEIADVPVANVNNSISGRIPGVLSFQSSGEPGQDATTLRVRGIGTNQSANSGALTIVDGIPRSFSQINPDEIESITVLKDAAAVAPYGVGGANGVILITTKRGKSGQIALNYNGWYGTQRPTRFPDYLNSYEYGKFLNEANLNYGFAKPYTDEQLQKYKDHSDPDHYPDFDWAKEVLNYNAPMTSHDLTLTGGSDKVRFFGSLGYLFQEGSVKTINYSRYNLAANVDIDATKTTLVSLDVKASLEKTNNPGATSGTGIYTSVTKNPPLLAQQLKFSNGLPGNGLLPSIYESGYNRENNNIVFTQLSIEQKLNFLPGLSIKGVAAYDKNYNFGKQWQTPYTYYTQNAQEEFIPVKTGVAAPQIIQNFQENEKITLQGYLTYNRSFGKHNVTALGVAEKRLGNNNQFSATRLNFAVPLDEISAGSTNKNDFDNSGGSSENRQLGFVYRVGYNFNQKYFFELAGRYDGHYYFAPGKRFAFFPAVSAGWRISEEPFIKNNLTWVDNLKIRGSYGLSGNLAGSPFQYLSSYGLNNSYVFGGSQFTQVQGIVEQAEPNPNITWETAKKLDIGLEATLWRGQLNFELDVFHEKRSDMLLTPSETIPTEYGIGISQINAGIMSNRGVDFSISTTQKITHDLRIDVAFNFTYAQNSLDQTFENASTFNNPNRRTTGRPFGTRFGYRAIGYFQDQKDIDTSAVQFGTLKVGEIKYQDINGDKKINANDNVVIGKPLNPAIIYGLNTNFSWKGFGLSMLWQGAAEGSIYLSNEAALPFFNGAKVFREQLDSWTPDNRNARYPIASPSPTTNNMQTSSFWIRSGSYLRLRTMQVGYSLPEIIISMLKIRSARVYVSGQNLLTFAAEKYIDPEFSNNRARYYFQQKVYAFGINVGF
jgi:TonB-linked SusC/RagA family outer membrane protein